MVQLLLTLQVFGPRASNRLVCNTQYFLYQGVIRNMIKDFRSFENWRSGLLQRDIFAFTMDIDWAAEYVIEKAVSFFIEHEIPLTIYCTHPSNVITRYSNHPLIHLGIHPNFIPGGSQGDSMDNIIDYVFSVVPGAVTMRAHRWFSSNDIYDRLVPRGILFDSNECALLDVVPPYRHRSGIIRFPVFWEDGGYLWHNLPLDFATEGERIFSRPGLKVINCHPFHFAVNTPYFSWTREIKDRLSREEYAALNEESLSRISWNGYGMRNFVMALTDFVHRRGSRSALLSELYAEALSE